MLQKWKEKSGRKATYRRLAKVFYKQQRLNLVDEICNLFRDDSSSSDKSVTVTDQQTQGIRPQGRYMVTGIARITNVLQAKPDVATS